MVTISAEEMKMIDAGTISNELMKKISGEDKPQGIMDNIKQGLSSFKEVATNPMELAKQAGGAMLNAPGDVYNLISQNAGPILKQYAGIPQKANTPAIDNLPKAPDVSSLVGIGEPQNLAEKTARFAGQLLGPTAISKAFELPVVQKGITKVGSMASGIDPEAYAKVLQEPALLSPKTFKDAGAKVGMEKQKLAGDLGNQAIDNKPIVASVYNAYDEAFKGYKPLEEIGKSKVYPAKLSKIETMANDAKNVDDLQRLKEQLDLEAKWDTNVKSKVQNNYIDTIKKIRQSVNDAIREKAPELAAANDRYSSIADIKESLDAFGGIIPPLKEGLYSPKTATQVLARTAIEALTPGAAKIPVALAQSPIIHKGLIQSLPKINNILSMLGKVSAPSQLLKGGNE